MVDGFCILEREKGGVNKVYFTRGGRRALLHFIMTSRFVARNVRLISPARNINPTDYLSFLQVCHYKYLSSLCVHLDARIKKKTPPFTSHVKSGLTS